MAARFLLQKFSSRVSRSSSLMVGHASASAGARAAATGATLAASHFNTFPCSLAGAKTSWPTTMMPSTIINHTRKRSVAVGYVGGAERSFSSKPSTRRQTSSKDKSAAKNGNSNDYMRLMLCLLGITCFFDTIGGIFDEED